MALVLQPSTKTLSPRPPTTHRSTQRANQPSRYLQLIWRVVCQGGRHEFLVVAVGVVGWVGGGPAGFARRAVRLIYAGWDRRTMVRRGVPLSSIGRGRPWGGGGLLKRCSSRAQVRCRRCWADHAIATAWAG